MMIFCDNEALVISLPERVGAQRFGRREKHTRPLGEGLECGVILRRGSPLPVPSTSPYARGMGEHGMEPAAREYHGDPRRGISTIPIRDGCLLFSNFCLCANIIISTVIVAVIPTKKNNDAMKFHENRRTEINQTR